MKYKSKCKTNLKESNINNVITTVNLKIKDIHILLDDLSTKNKYYNNSTNQKTNICLRISQIYHHFQQLILLKFIIIKEILIH